MTHVLNEYNCFSNRASTIQVMSILHPLIVKKSTTKTNPNKSYISQKPSTSFRAFGSTILCQFFPMVPLFFTMPLNVLVKQHLEHLISTPKSTQSSKGKVNREISALID